ncbi:hypothetical protein SAMN06297382_2432 [Amphiplicatus metriothermophilus]|uniref:Uncharacterized protein n=1 Tax=Amphiplicatus metriothermophilus TaxID=1519374 RepID=A0A239PY10_9PROT|nr:hypothetical protein [Amphiplicatus metriothermophilus]SNT74842.1 hypothetical protein SAMN06297382_2432 [Amphiplicatus metriothermophilus]
MRVRRLGDRRSISFVYDALFHHEIDVLKNRDVRQRIAFDGDDVGGVARRDAPELVALPERLGRKRRRRFYRLIGVMPKRTMRENCFALSPCG